MNDVSKNDIEGLDKATQKEIIDLVVARLNTMPAGASLYIGGQGDFSVKELIKDVEQTNDIGLSIIKTQMDYLRSLKDLPFEDIAAV